MEYICQSTGLSQIILRRENEKLILTYDSINYVKNSNNEPRNGNARSTQGTRPY
jgi:hypothetical protein